MSNLAHYKVALDRRKRKNKQGRRKTEGTDIVGAFRSVLGGKRRKSKGATTAVIG
jgi:hypothetical protein